MRPLRLEIRGFSAFREYTAIDLTDIDLVALVGPTGSGKSTIIDAITFALYGSVARYQDNRAVAPVINQTSAEARVQLTFELNGVEHVAVRVVRRTKKGASTKEARLERGAETLAADARSMSAQVQDLLGLDVEQFNRTVVLPQGRFADFLHDDPSHRQATLRQLLGLDVYVRIGKAARARASEKRIQADVLRDDLDAGAGELTDERYETLTARIGAIEDARTEFDTLRSAHEQATAEEHKSRERVEEAAARLEFLEDVSVPREAETLDAALTTATADFQLAQDQSDAARAALREAKTAVEQGPDRAVVELQLGQHEQLVTLRREVETLTDEMSTLEGEIQAVAARAKELRDRQRELDVAVDDAAAAADEARSRAEQAPSIVQVDSWLDKRSQHTAHVDMLSAATARMAAATEQIPAAERLVETLTTELGELDELVAALQERVGIAAYAAHLTVGDECPLCLQEVRELPDHHMDVELATARHRRDERSTVLEEAKSQLGKLNSEANRVKAELDAARSLAERSEADLEGVPATGDLESMRVEAERLASESQVARAAAQAAGGLAKQHRDDLENQRVIEAEQTLATRLAKAGGRASTLAEQIAALEQELATAPSLETCVGLVETTEELAAALRQAEEAEEGAHAELEAARARVSDARQHLDAARSQLQRTRDRLAPLGPPSIGGASLTEDWAVIADWVEARRGEIDAERAKAEAELDRITTKVSELSDGAQGTVQAVAPEATVEEASMARLGEFLAGMMSSAEADRRAFDEQKAKLEVLWERIQALEEEEAVAKKLGHLLRTDGFEGWLMQAALDQLAGRATERLLELSDSQYSLVLDDRAFSVRDHSNADEIRSARTLSGGETFLASLSLALALAEATAELAPDGAPQIDSIFLDEGFGTLDPHTLDIVAGAIEELAASGRMVGIVTHIRELADRMPVRLEVTKSGGTARVNRADV